LEENNRKDEFGSNFENSSEKKEEPIVEKREASHNVEKAQIHAHEKKEIVHHPHHHVTKNKKMNGWKVSSFVLGILLVLTFALGGGPSLSPISGDAVAEEAVEFINTQLLQGQTTATLEEVSSEKGLVKATINVQGQATPVYITNDGELMFLQAIPLGEVAGEATDVPQQAPPQEQPPAAVVPKSDKPVVEVFVMSHCPFGTQMEKGLLPVVKELGDSIDFDLKFVYYAMHGEKEVNEQAFEYCIQKEQEDKLLDYLYCFLGSESGSETEAADCRAEVGVDEDMLATCVEAADEEFNLNANLEDTDSWLSGRFPLFDIYKADNEKYEVGGSPTLVINGESVSSGRDSVSLLGAICNAFNEQPEACNTEFEAGNPTSGFGWGTSGQANTAAAGCGA
jgi:hypothetical protein